MQVPEGFTVERIPAPDADGFRRDYLERQLPVILTGLFEGQPLASITDEEQAYRDLGWLRLPVGAEYFSTVAKKGRPEPVETMRLDEYLDLQRTQPGSLRMCSEQPTPALMLAKFRLPAYDTFDDSISSFFVGHAGQYAHMHFDGDYRHVLFHQIFGTKRFIFIRPDRNRLIPAAGNMVEWSLQNMAEDEIQRLLAFTGGVDCTLHAGETMLIPASIWHYVGYTTTSMSLNLRFGRNAFTRFLSQNLHLSKSVQSLAWRMSNVAGIPQETHAQYQRVVQAVEATYCSEHERYETLQDLLEDVNDVLDGRAGRPGMISSDRIRAVYRAGALQTYADVQAARQPAVCGWETVNA